MPAGDHGIPAAFSHYPSAPPAFVAGPVGAGGDVDLLLQGTIKVPEGKNQWWQALNKALGVSLKYNGVISADYPKKFATNVAGNDIPDITQVFPVPGLPKLLASQFADLTEYLSGDAGKEYPGLAAINPQAWKTASVNGRIFGVPQERPTAGLVCTARGDLLEKYGVSGDVSSGDEFLDLCKQLTDQKHNRWAIGSDPTAWTLPYMQEMLGAPNRWAENDGKFTSVYETDQMKEALSNVTKMWKAGYIHPDSFASPGENGTWWEGGVTTLLFQQFTGWSTWANRHPEWGIEVIAAPKWGGGGLAGKLLGPGAYNDFVGFKKAGADRIKEMLRIANYIASPFGTQEYLTVNYGVKGVDYTLSGSDPVPSKQGSSESMIPIQYIGSAIFSALYVPGQDDTLKKQYDYLVKVLPIGVDDPTVGLFSETALGDGITAGHNIIAVEGDVIQGRKSLSDWDQAVNAWRKNGGDQMRKEYQDAFAASH
jgi:putative aldouronate transport system substrate-binding protein